MPTAGLYYIDLCRTKDAYKDVNDDNFYDYIQFKKAYNFEPWHCVDFINNPELVKKYFEVMPDDKARMRKYEMMVTHIRCNYTWSDSMYEKTAAQEYYAELYRSIGGKMEPEEITSVYIEKKPEEMRDMMR